MTEKWEKHEVCVLANVMTDRRGFYFNDSETSAK